MIRKRKILIGSGIGLIVLLLFISGTLLLKIRSLNNIIANDPDSAPVKTERSAASKIPVIEVTAESDLLTIDPETTTFVEKSVAYCKALAPEDWSFTSVSPYVGADLLSPDGRIHAGWGIAPVFKSLFPTVESGLNYLMNAVYPGFVLRGINAEIGYGFWSWEFETSNGKKGQIIYKVYDSDPGFFIISIYMAAADTDLWEISGAQALSSAISIRCVSQLRPATAGIDLGSSDPSEPDANPEVDLSTKWTEAIMGYENVYSPTLGDHYLAPLNSYWEGGPEGGGYYRELPGGGVEKLLDGFGDY